MVRDVRILVRETRLGAQYVDRGGVTTGADGRFVFPVPREARRRAAAGLSRLPRRRRVRRALDVDAEHPRAHLGPRPEARPSRTAIAKFSGRLVGRPFPPRGITVDLQIFQPGVGWRVFGNARTRKRGTFTVRYHFQRASQGRFTFRIRLRPTTLIRIRAV